MAFVALPCCWLVSLALLAFALYLVSAPARWNRAAYYLAYFILCVVLAQTLLVSGAVLAFA